MNERITNFSPGPAVLPVPVLERIRDEMLSLPGAGASILEISHRSPAFIDILQATKANLTQLLDIPAHYRILFLQGGSRLLFSMIPMNLLRGGTAPAEYLLTGSWGKYARDEAVREGAVHIPWDGKGTGYDRVPSWSAIPQDKPAAYLHITSNETIQGVQFRDFPTGDKNAPPLVCDMSSDFLSRPVPIDRFGLIYACAQKNAGPAGVTIVIIREDLLARGDKSLPGYLNFQQHAEQDSLFNTPPTFAIYVVKLVTEWLLRDVGGLAQMDAQNREKAQWLYNVIDQYPQLYAGHAQSGSRSLMNVTFRLPDDATETRFLAGAKQRGLMELKGHRSVGGIRASIYNAMPVSGVEALRDYMIAFAAQSA